MADARQIVADNVARVRERIAAAAIAAGRDPGEISLVAVSKYVNTEITTLLLAAGCSDLGESRPQDLWSKSAAPELAAARWHLVGRLQRNKVRRTLPLVSLVHSVDSERLLAAVNEQAVALQVNARIFIEVNCSGDAAKQGFSTHEVCALGPMFGQYPSVQVAGLMTMAPLEGGEAAARLSFAALRALRDELVELTPPGVALDELSMGMSSDFEAAIAEGATLVRIGSLLVEGVI